MNDGAGSLTKSAASLFGFLFFQPILNQQTQQIRYVDPTYRFIKKKYEVCQ